MPYYHVVIGLKSTPRRGAFEINLTEQDLRKRMVEPYNKGEVFKCGAVVVDQDSISYIRITKSKQRLFLASLFLDPKSEGYFASCWEDIVQEEDVTDEFIKKLPQIEKEMLEEGMPGSANVFIVHGRNHKPMKELKTMLKDFGLKSVVLHEQPSGSRTIVEKLEKYSDVGYAFVILTPDDVGSSSENLDLILSNPEGLDIEDVFDMELMEKRARQNVILEFGYFMGLLGRSKVCCLYKGDTGLPSDMSGIVYILFKKSVNEVRDKIVKELKAAGYRIEN